MKRLITFLVCCGTLLPASYGQTSTRVKRCYSTKKVQKIPVIDGDLSDEAWSFVEWDGDFHMYDPYDDRPATQETRFKVVIDEENIYIAIRAFDTQPDSIVRRLTRRDDVDGDFIAINLDSYHDLQTAFGFWVSVAGSKVDMLISGNGSNEDETWNAIWWAGTQMDELGWTAEIMIPFSQLRFDKNSGGTWGLQIGRLLARNNEVSLWQAMKKEDPGWVHLMGEINGLENIHPKKQADITPFLVAGEEFYEKEAGNPFREKGRNPVFNAGLDAKLGISNNFTLDLSVNPDFGQVEADPSQVNLSAYEIFFREQRPFFIEGKNILEYRLNNHGRNSLFYSRRIGRQPHYEPDLIEGEEYARIPAATKILGAAKISGKTKNGLSVGVMECLTANEQALIDKGSDQREETVEPMSNYFAARVSQDINKGNTQIGAMLTSTHRPGMEEHLEYLHASAYSGGLDFKQYFSERSYELSANVYGSQVNGTTEALIKTQRSAVRYFQRPDADYVEVDSNLLSLSGYGGYLSMAKQGGDFTIGTLVGFNSPGLELNDLGFLGSTDEISQVTWANYSFNEPFSIFRSIHIHADQYNIFDFGGTHQLFSMNLGTNARFSNLWNAGIFWEFRTDAIINAALRGGPSLLLPGRQEIFAFISSNESKKFSAEFDASFSQGFDASASSYEFDLELSYKPIPNLRMELETEYEHSWETLQYIDQENFDGNDRYIFGSIDQNTFVISLRVDLILTPEMTIQFWGQPFLASGNYEQFNYITEPKAEVFTDRFRVYEENEITYIEEDEHYMVQETASGLNYGFDNPDFSVKEFLSNLVFRWEYRPGSYLYLVWSQNRSGYDSWGDFRFYNDFSDLWDVPPSQTLLLKLSYRIGR